MLYRTKIETRNFSFEAYGISSTHAKAALFALLTEHAKHRNVVQGWVTETMEDACEPYLVCPFRGLRDGEVIVAGTRNIS